MPDKAQRLPCLVRWPGWVEPGRSSDEIIQGRRRRA
jgi:hypothetical protein